MAGRRKFPRCSNFLVAPLFLHFLLFFPSGNLICNAEFDSNSSCLDRLNNFGTISLQKLQKFSTKCDQLDNRDLNV